MNACLPCLYFLLVNIRRQQHRQGFLLLTHRPPGVALEIERNGETNEECGWVGVAGVAGVTGVVRCWWSDPIKEVKIDLKSQ